MSANKTIAVMFINIGFFTKSRIGTLVTVSPLVVKIVNLASTPAKLSTTSDGKLLYF